jgi:hypothetical protein
MGMKAQVARPGLQDPQQADLTAKEARVACQLLERGGRGLKEQGVESALVRAGQLAQRWRQREGDQEVGHQQQQFLLPREPGLGGVVLAGRAVAVAVGMVTVALGTAGRADVELAAKCLGATVLNRLHRRQLARQHPLAKLGSVGWPIATEDLAERNHGMPTINRSSASLASSSALRVRWV